MRHKLPACYGFMLFIVCCLILVVKTRSENRIVYSKNTEFEREREVSPIHRKRREVRPDINEDVYENATIGFVVYTFNNTINNRYVMKNYNPRFEVSGNEVIVKEQLDYETSPEETVTVVYWNSNAPSTSDEVSIIITILDVNEPPEWTMEYEPYLAVTKLNVVNGVNIYTLSAQDPEDPSAEIVYELFIDESKMFAVNPVTGYIYIDKQPGASFEDNKEYTLTVTAYEKSDMSMGNSADVKVKVGERPPQFTSDSYTLTVSEDTSVPVNLITVKAKSFDRSETVSYTIEEQPTGIDHVIDKDGVITLKTKLDRETFGSYVLRIKAADSHGESISVVHINILDVNDNGPVFTQFVYHFRDISEGVGLDTSVGQVVVSDEDGKFYGSVLLSIPVGEPFRIDEDGNIYPTSKLDYESNPVYDFVVTAVDLGGKSSTASVRIDLLNINDMSPIFSESSYAFDVDDTVEEGYKINTVYASDPDGDLVTFSIESCGQCLFVIDSKTGVISRSSVSDNLDKASYSFTVVASDDGTCCSGAVTNSAKTNVTISINDINDNVPVFPDCNSYSPSIPERSPRLSSVLIVTATDADPGVNGEITFELKENDLKRGYFEIEDLGSGQGLLKTKREFDREVDESFSLTLLAEDSAKYGLTGFCQITVIVNDTNDEFPELSPSQVTIPRSLTVNSVVTNIEAFDPDLEDIEKGLIYTLEDPSNEFYLDADGTLKVKASLASAPSDIELSVKVTDQAGQDQTGTVEITLIDGQVDAPTFTVQQLIVDVPEDKPIGEEVFTVTATSPDQSTIIYIIIPGNTPETNNPRQFSIDQGTGSVTVFGDNLDYEKVQSYDLLIQATDSNTQLASYLTVVVNIEDRNDQTPEFDLSEYVANIEEGDYTGQNKLVVTVHAEDADTVPIYKMVLYEQDPMEYNSLFDVNQANGEIRTSGTFDRENNALYLIYILAKDNAPSSISPSEPNIAKIIVTVHIIDRNDNNPTFPNAAYSASVAENAKSGYSIETVTAVDIDEDSVLNYLIAGGRTLPDMLPYQSAVFQVDSETGTIKVAASLDFEAVQTYELEYIVTDGLHENTTKLTINILDTNDNSPEFVDDVYRSSITEEEDSVAFPFDVLTVSATDADADSGTIRYSLKGHDSNYFAIDSTSGMITLLRFLDYEYKTEWHFIAEATDENGAGLTGVTDVLISVTDINDNPPEFNQASYEGEIAENADISTYVMTVSATDADSPAQSNNKYTLEPLSESDLPSDGVDGISSFRIEQDGDIFTTIELDREIIDKYYVLVKAEDQSTSESATATATIIVLDVNDNAPEFYLDPYSQSVLESLPVGDKVVDIFATDEDIGVNAELKFTFLSGNEGSEFGITRNPVNKQNAVIYLMKELDFETTVKYDLVIEASDQVFADTATATINVVNVNEAPVFGQETYFKSVVENNMSNPFITVSASDVEGDDISYEIDPATNVEKWLAIDSDTGIVTQDKPFDREDSPTHNFRVWAIDNGSPPATGSCTISVTVIDVNDECPRLEDDYKPKTMENQKPPQVVEIITAKDPDEGVQTPYKFSIVNGDVKEGQYTVNEAFELETISDTSAEIRTRKEFDRESQKFYEMEIKTEDNEGISCTSTVTIEIGDENDNPHQAGEKSMAVFTYEGGTSTGVGTIPVGPVNSPDPDDDDLDEKTFTKLNEDDWVFFDLDTDTGVILIKEGTPDGIYKMEILVQDNKFPDQISTVTVTVTDLPEEAVYNSGSMRMSGDSQFNAAEFVREPNSIYNTLRTTLAEILGTPEGNVDVFSVMDVEGKSNMVDVRGLSARELWFQRDQFTNEQIDFSDLQLISQQHQQRQDNHPYSEKSKNTAQVPPAIPDLYVGDLVYLHKDLDKSKARSRYLIASIDGDWCNIRKFSGTQLRSNTYRVKKTECFKVPPYVPLRTSVLPPCPPIESYTPLTPPVTPIALTHDTPTVLPVSSELMPAQSLPAGVPAASPAEQVLPDTVHDSNSVTPTPCDGSPGDTCITPSTFPTPADKLISPPPLRRSSRQRHTPTTVCVISFKSNLAYWRRSKFIFKMFCIFHSCTCPTGFEGGRCEMTKRSFEGGKSYAWVETLEQCEETVASIEFITDVLDGTLFYNGPMQKNANQRDFILLELVGGRPRLQLNLGDNTVELAFSSNDLNQLNDNVWHTLEIRRNAQYVEMVVDHCKSAVVVENSGTSTIDATSCMVNKTVPGNSKLLNLNTPLQIGGVDTESPWVYDHLDSTPSGFDGCVRNLIQDGKLYDLSDNNVGTSFYNSQQGCPRTDENCIDNTDGTSLCKNGICDADTKTGVCICYPGYTGDKCDQETTPYDFALNSFVDYTVKPAAELDTSGYEEHYHSMVRTWKETGLVWYIANLDTGEHTTIDMVDGTLRLRYNHGEGEYSMSLPNYRMNNGAWHSVEYDRYGNYVTLKVDRGGGTRQVEGSPGTYQHIIVNPESLRIGDLFGNEVILQDFQGCMNDPRIKNHYLGFSSSSYADVTSSNNVTEGCISDACNGVTCDPPFVCNDIWRQYECTCPANTGGESCTVTCDPNPCQNGGNCIEEKGGAVCICPKGYSGDFCGMGERTGGNGLSGAVIAIICICLLFFIVLLVLLLLYKNQNLRRKKAILEYENDDLAEHLAYYDEEGGGEEDHAGYDIGTLSKPIDQVEGSVGSLEKSRIPVSAVPVGNAKPDESVKVAGLFDDRLPKVDDDPDNSPLDSLHLYDYEGEGSTAGSLSTINSCSTDSSQDFEYLSNWGPQFKKLADMYGGGED
ncbi:neural-cadherin-like [Anneissia japonica]|uniref:neural-cadherin-like n=1 Tax=Anneissia japonica TaxID=1529436 RepID=UPI0014257F69|nr:neural-cadherin-like [Anneissia japonica]